VKGQPIGDRRVSRFDKNPERQLEHVPLDRDVPLDRLFTDKASGKVSGDLAGCGQAAGR